jgi:flavin-dependent thymidylate synthase
MLNNKVELIGFYGSDEVHAASAWSSTCRDITEEKRARIPKLLKDLATAGHHTPFEKSSLHFLVDTDIASHIHLLKHRIGISLNAESARYKELKEDKFYIPDDWKDIKVVNGVSSECYEDFIFAAEGEDWQKVIARYTKLGNDLYHQCLKDLEPTLGRKRAKESARFFKTYNSQIQSDIMFNWRSFHHFLELRNKLDAQKEIRDISSMMLDLVKNIEGNPFKHTIEALAH